MLNKQPLTVMEISMVLWKLRTLFVRYVAFKAFIFSAFKQFLETVRLAVCSLQPIMPKSEPK